MSDQTPSQDDVRDAVLRCINRAANASSTTKGARDVAEAYALLAGSITSVSHVEVKN